MYFIILSRVRTLHPAGQTGPQLCRRSAEALRPLAGDAAGVLFAVGVVGVGFLAVPIMTTGAAYDLAQVMGWKHSLHAKTVAGEGVLPCDRRFYGAGDGDEFPRLQSDESVWSIREWCKGSRTPPLLLMIMLMTNSRKIMGKQTNSRGLNILGWITTAANLLGVSGISRNVVYVKS
jgi:Mn2+/Fe2+ NRAMP family transporter